jgi:gluconolactonase
MSHLEVVDRKFEKLVIASAQLERIFVGGRWTEGPVYFSDADQLIFSDIPNNRLMRWTPDGQTGVYRQPSNFTNGNTRDVMGRLISCQHGTRSVVRTEFDGTLTTLAESYEGKRLNSPNDVVVRSDGTIWFTDPTYGILSDYEGYRTEPEQDGCYVYRVDPRTGRIDRVADGFQKPNGLAFSVDESVLYVADSGVTHTPGGNHHIRRFEVQADGSLHGGAPLMNVPRFPDGFRIDELDNIWTSAGDGVYCYAPDGTLLGKVLVPEGVANLVFGGVRRNRLFITATSSVFSIYVAVRGAANPAQIAH